MPEFVGVKNAIPVARWSELGRISSRPPSSSCASWRVLAGTGSSRIFAWTIWSHGNAKWRI